MGRPGGDQRHADRDVTRNLRSRGGHRRHASAPVAPAPSAILPDGWSDSDIGNVGFTGGAAFDVPSTTFSVKAAGNDIWGTADAFHYVYRAVTGDGLIAARVRSLANTSASAKGGVMIRETLDAGAANAFVPVTPTKGTMFQRRTAAGAASVSTAGTLTKAPAG